MIGNYNFFTPLKLMEFMDLIEFPHHHQLTKVVYGAYWPGSSLEDETYRVFYWIYRNGVTNAAGTLLSYQTDNPPYDNTFYNAWDCSGKEPWQTINPTQTDFMRMSHNLVAQSDFPSIFMGSPTRNTIS